MLLLDAKKIKALENMILEDGRVLESGEAKLEGVVEFFSSAFIDVSCLSKGSSMKILSSVIF